MLLNTVILVGLIGHVIGDFYLQSDGLANDKNEKIGHLLLHTLIYFIPFAIFFLLAKKTLDLGILFILFWGTHLVFDLIKFAICNSDYYKKFPEKQLEKERVLYISDQGLHILSIVVISVIFVKLGHSIEFLFSIREFIEYIDINIILVSKWILLLLCIYKPSNVSFVKMFSEYKPNKVHITQADNDTCIQVNNKKAGAIIGFLERILIVILIHVGQYPVIGLILTAKSIARYDSIVKDQEFAEYYLIGTLTSVLLAILFYLGIFIGL